jgi:hypothetical protein
MKAGSDYEVPPLSDQSSACSLLLQMLAESFLPHAREEIARHKWIESEKARQDLGEKAVEDWLSRFWWRFCRWRRLEHIEGKRCWREFNDLDHAILRQVVMERDLLEAIMNRMRGDGDHHIHDNLEIILWAIGNQEIQYQRVEEFLLLIDINAARLPVPRELRFASVA